MNRSTGTFFGVQIAFSAARDAALRHQLAAAVAGLRQGTDPTRFGPGLRAASAILAGANALIRRGDWDFVQNRGQEVYREWQEGLESMAGWPADDFGTDGDLILATLILLVRPGSAAETALGDGCDLPEDDWFLRRTFAKLLLLPTDCTAGDVAGAGLFVAPHPGRGSFSTDALADEGFDYLRVVTG